MALNVKRATLLSSLHTYPRYYCEYKSIYEREEAKAKGRLPRKVHGKVYPEWRKPWIQREGEWSSKLSIFVEKTPSMNILNAMQRLPNLTINDVKEFWANMKVIQEINNQKYLSERVAALGINLAAVHFFTYRNCAVRLKDDKHWIIGDITTLNLPTHFVEGYYVEAIDCSNFHHNGIRYEGLKNLTGLNFLKWLSLKNNKHVDVWCIDRLAGQNGATLEFLNIQGCQLCVGCIYALARMPALKYLTISNPIDNIELQAALSQLEQERPELLIIAHDDNEENNVSKK